ncbi:von Willebrand factor type A domain protein [Phycisphaerae bacterium RAS2]|nr:von Willebrand factor type A domain protein [Phycisphaerae bacterium RAS2]
MIQLAHPWYLVLALLVPVVWWAYLRRKGRAMVQFSDVSVLVQAGAARKARWRTALPALRTLTVLMLVLSVARPQKADEQTRVQTEGIAIQLVVDRSGSMREPFGERSGRRISRLEVVKDVVREFVEGNKAGLAGRRDDLVGLIVFARFPDTECPLTRDHQHVLRALDDVEPPTTRDEDGTAIGDALLLAVERIRNIERRFQKTDDYKVKSRVIVLLTDGEQNAGKYEPEKAAEAAAALGVKVYTIGALPDYVEQQSLFGPTMRVPVQINDEPLKKVAELTGGKYFRAKDAEALAQVYAAIDQLERSAIDETRYYLMTELAYNWLTWGVFQFPPPLFVALGLLALEVMLAQTRLRTIP